MQIAVDRQAGAAHTTLCNVPYAFGVDLDHARRVDFGEDRRPIGVELLNIEQPVDLRDLPERDAIAYLLHANHIPVLKEEPIATHHERIEA